MSFSMGWFPPFAFGTVTLSEVTRIDSLAARRYGVERKLRSAPKRA